MYLFRWKYKRNQYKIFNKLKKILQKRHFKGHITQNDHPLLALSVGSSFVNYIKWMLRVNEANEGFNKMKWRSSPSERKNEGIIKTKTRKKQK